MMHIRTALRRLAHDQRGFATSFFVRTIIAFALVALVINEVGQILMTEVHAHNAAGAAAQAAATQFKGTRNLAQAHEAALQAMAGEDPKAKLVKLTINTTQYTATAVVKETANTLVVSRVSFLQHYGQVRASDLEVAPTA
jgi:Flp pilus assembly protein TadG